jgi:hypothetical protein
MAARLCVLLAACHAAMLLGPAGGDAAPGPAARWPARPGWGGAAALRLRGGGLIKKKSKAGHAVRKAKKRGLWYVHPPARRRGGGAAPALRDDPPLSVCPPLRSVGGWVEWSSCAWTPAIDDDPAVPQVGGRQDDEAPGQERAAERRPDRRGRQKGRRKDAVQLRVAALCARTTAPGPDRVSAANLTRRAAPGQIDALRTELDNGGSLNARVRQGPTSLLLSTPLHLAGGRLSAPPRPAPPRPAPPRPAPPRACRQGGLSGAGP